MILIKYGNPGSHVHRSMVKVCLSILYVWGLTGTVEK